MELISKKEAAALGLTTFFNGKPCPRGQIAERRVVGGACLCQECRQLRADKARAKYQLDPVAGTAKSLDYQRRNPEKFKASNNRWKTANADRVLKIRADFYQKNRQSELQKVKDYYLANREQILREKSVRDLLRRKKLSDYQREHRRKNPHLMVASNKKRAEAESLRIPAWFGDLDAFVISEAKHLRKLREKHVGGRWVVDHCLPIMGKEVSGLHCWNNVQVIPSNINSKKYNNLIFTEPFEWMALVEHR